MGPSRGRLAVCIRWGTTRRSLFWCAWPRCASISGMGTVRRTSPCSFSWRWAACWPLVPARCRGRRPKRRWFAFDGPDTPDNGLALCSLHHKLFDLGALGLDQRLRKSPLTDRAQITQFRTDDGGTHRLQTATQIGCPKPS
jgi:hypothetical protein